MRLIALTLLLFSCLSHSKVLCDYKAALPEMQAAAQTFIDEGRGVNWRTVAKFKRKDGQLTCREFSGFDDSCESVTITYNLFAETDLVFTTLKMRQQTWPFVYEGGLKDTDYCENR